MVSQFLAELQPSLSAPRLQRYADPSGDPLQVALGYLWNVALAESLYCSLNAVELALRNGPHSSLTQHFGRPDWYDGHGILDGGQRGQVEKAKKTIAAYGDTVTPDRVVSQVTFGFWVTILSRNYDARLWSANNAAPLKNAFLRLPKNQRQRHMLHTRYNHIRELRNRVMHHEPLFDDGLLMVR